MDLTLFFRVMWRYRLLVVSGLLLAVLAAFFAMVKVSPGGDPALALRGQKEYASYTTLFVTQKGFPWGRLAEGDGQAAANNASRLASLASLYSQLAVSDPVDEMNKTALPSGEWKIESAPVLDANGTNAQLPLVRIAALAPTAELAQQTAATAAASLQSYVGTRQRTNDIPESERVVLQLIKGPEKAVLVHGRSFTQPIIVFALLAMITLALPFIIDNIRRSLAAARAGDPMEDREAGPDGAPSPSVSFEASDIEERRRIARLSQ